MLNYLEKTIIIAREANKEGKEWQKSQKRITKGHLLLMYYLEFFGIFILLFGYFFICGILSFLTFIYKLRVLGGNMFSQQLERTY